MMRLSRCLAFCCILAGAYAAALLTTNGNDGSTHVQTRRLPQHDIHRTNVISNDIDHRDGTRVNSIHDRGISRSQGQKNYFIGFLSRALRSDASGGRMDRHVNGKNNRESRGGSNGGKRIRRKPGRDSNRNKRSRGTPRRGAEDERRSQGGKYGNRRRYGKDEDDGKRFGRGNRGGRQNKRNRRKFRGDDDDGYSDAKKNRRGGRGRKGGRGRSRGGRGRWGRKRHRGRLGRDDDDGRRRMGNRGRKRGRGKRRMSGGDEDNGRSNSDGKKGSERNKGKRRKADRDEDDKYKDEKENDGRKRNGKHSNGKARIDEDKEGKRGGADNKSSGSTFSLSGQSDSSGTGPSMPAECACVQTSGREGVCYDITDYETMACRARSCDDKYECVTSEAARQVVKAEVADGGNEVQVRSGSRQEGASSVCRLKKVSKRITRNTAKPGYCNEEASESWAYFLYTNVV